MTLYLATASGPVVRAAMTRGEIGQLRTPAAGNRVVDGATWAADNGLFGNGYPGDDGYLAWLAKPTDEQRARCLFAVAPDVPYDMPGTLERSRPMLAKIRAAGYRVALALQDGAETIDLPWGEFDVAFIGGTTEWKLSTAAHDLAVEARRRGKMVHVGRVNSGKRYARFAGLADTVDGTFLAFGPGKNLKRLQQWTSQTVIMLPQGDACA